MPKTTSTQAAKPNLDLLRSVAVLFVVAAHIFTALGHEEWHGVRLTYLGPFGVYLFFVHTSLVLMWSLERRPNTLDFYVRRVFRLYPLAIASVVLAAVTHAPVANIFHKTFTATHVTPMGLVMNCLILNGLVGHQQLINGVMWSLPPELFMYVLLPGLFFYARTVRKLWPLLVLWVFAALFAHQFFPGVGINIFPVLIPNFIAGVIAYVGFMRRRPTLPSWTMLPVLLGLLGVWGYLSCFYAVRFDWFACLALGLALPSIRQMKTGVLSRSAHTVATYSYGVYLLHPFSIVLGMYVLASKPVWLQLVVALLPIPVMAYAAYHLIERPMIGLGARVAAKLAHERGLPSEKSLEDLEPAP